MGNSLALKDRVLQMAEATVDRILFYLPSILGAVVLLLLGWILAKLLRAGSHRLLQLLDAVLTRLLGEGRASRIRLARSAQVLGNIVFWAVMLFFLAAATEVLGFAAFSDWLARLLDHLPTVIAGLLIVFAGYLLSRFVADLILGTGRLAAAQRVALARAAQVAILVSALLVGADQIGIKITFLAIFAGAAAVAIAGGAIVAISAGARQHVANLIGAQQLRQSFEVGQSIRVAGFEGRILEINSRGLLLETGEGRVSVPGHLFNEQAVVLLAPRGDTLRDG